MKKYLIIFLLFSSLLLSEDSGVNVERLVLSFASDKNNNITPQVNIPIYWSDSLFSSIAYNQTSSFEHTSFSSAEDANSKFVTTVDMGKTSLNLLTYQHKNYTLGVTSGYRKYDIIQYGYTDYYESGTNERKVMANDMLSGREIYQLGINADYSQSNIYDFFSLRFGALLYPVNYMTYSEKVHFTPTIDHEASLEGAQFQDLQYSMFATFFFNTGSYVNFLLHLRYEYLPQSLDVLDVANEDFTIYYDAVSYEEQAKIISTNLKFLFPKFALNGISPSLGIEYKRQKVHAHYSNRPATDETFNDTLILFGLDKPF